MKVLALILATAALALSADSASAQIVSVGLFVGQYSEGFETQFATEPQTCIPGRISNSTADVCYPSGNGIMLSLARGFMCSIFPQAGGRFSGSAGGPVEFTFDTPATRFGGYFGGYFGTNAGTADGVIEFYDAGNVLISSHTITSPANCIWTWNGWIVTGGPAIKRAKVISNSSFGGGYQHMDSMDVNYGSVCLAPTTYCFAKITANGCIPTVGFSGSSSVSAGSGFNVTGTNFINNKSCLLFYGVSGPAAASFQGGLLCVKAQVKRTPGTTTGGNPPPNDCSGAPAIDMNAFAAGSLGGTPFAALMVIGTVVNCQWWGRDPGFVTQNNTMLSNGLQYTVCH